MPFPNESTQFQSGQSGNPTGSSRKQRLTSALAKVLEEEGEEAFVRVGISAAKSGDFNFWKYIYERIDGKLPDADQTPELELKNFTRKLKDRLAKNKNATDGGTGGGGS